MKPYYENGGITIYHGRFMDLASIVGPDSVDAVITDPPYNAGKKYGEHDDSLAPDEYRELVRDWLRLAARITRDAVVYFPGTKNVIDTNEVLRDTGLRFVRMLGWHKREYAGDKWNGGPAMCWEPVIWASKVEKPHYNKIFGQRGRDFLTVAATHGDPFAKWHPCPKPLPVMHWLVGLFVPERGSLLDPFMGTGSTLRAARDLTREAIGFEQEGRYCERTVLERLGQEVLDLGAAA